VTSGEEGGPRNGVRRPIPPVGEEEGRRGRGSGDGGEAAARFPAAGRSAPSASWDAALFFREGCVFALFPNNIV